MRSTFRAVILSLAVLALGLSTGCSDYGGTGPAAARMVTGVAATGAPVVGAVTLKDSSPASTELTTMTASDGSFAFNTAGLTPPFILKTSAGGVNMYSLATDTGIANLTPLTTMAMSQAAEGADLDALYDRPVQADIRSVAVRMPEAVQALQEALAPLMDSFGVTTNILSGQFSANHTGMDAMLDAVSVSISAGTVTVANRQSGAAVFAAPSANLRAGSMVSANMPSPAAPQSPASGTAIYAARCAGCHGPLVNSSKLGATGVRIQNAISGNVGGMGMLAGMTPTDIQAVSDALVAPASPPSAGGGTSPAPDGAALYAANCAGCHEPLGTSGKKGSTVVRIQNAISGNVGGMGSLTSLTAADIRALSIALNPPGSTPAPQVPSTPPPADTTTTPAPAPDGAALYAANCTRCHGALVNSAKKGATEAQIQLRMAAPPFASRVLTAAEVQAVAIALNPTDTTVPITPPPTDTTTSPTPDGSALYTTNCAGCHGALATTDKRGVTIARLQNAINNNTGNMGPLSRLTVTEVQAIVTALTPDTATPTPQPPAVPDGAALYGSNCAGCHNPLATSAKGGATATRIQSAINGNVGGMGYLSTFSSAQVNAIADALAAITPPSTPAPACGSCHGIPPSTGRHSTHRSRSCSTCHGTGYSTTAVNAATHNNGVKNMATNIGWNATSRSCSNSCHGTERW